MVMGMVVDYNGAPQASPLADTDDTSWVERHSCRRRRAAWPFPEPVCASEDVDLTRETGNECSGSLYSTVPPAVAGGNREVTDFVDMAARAKTSDTCVFVVVHAFAGYRSDDDVQAH